MGEGTTSMEYVCGRMCQISTADPGEVFPGQGIFLELLIPSLVWGQLGHVSQQTSSPQAQARECGRAAVLPGLVPLSSWSRLQSPPWCSCLDNGFSGKWLPALGAAGW